MRGYNICHKLYTGKVSRPFHWPNPHKCLHLSPSRPWDLAWGAYWGGCCREQRVGMGHRRWRSSYQSSGGWLWSWREHSHFYRDVHGAQSGQGAAKWQLSLKTHSITWSPCLSLWILSKSNFSLGALWAATLAWSLDSSLLTQAAEP